MAERREVELKSPAYFIGLSEKERKKRMKMKMKRRRNTTNNSSSNNNSTATNTGYLLCILFTLSVLIVYLGCTCS